jgi:hypothetical protein
MAGNEFKVRGSGVEGLRVPGGPIAGGFESTQFFRCVGQHGRAGRRRHVKLRLPEFLPRLAGDGDPVNHAEALLLRGFRPTAC